MSYRAPRLAKYILIMASPFLLDAQDNVIKKFKIPDGKYGCVPRNCPVHGDKEIVCRSLAKPFIKFIDKENDGYLDAVGVSEKPDEKPTEQVIIDYKLKGGITSVRIMMDGDKSTVSIITSPDSSLAGGLQSKYRKIRKDAGLPVPPEPEPKKPAAKGGKPAERDNIVRSLPIMF